MDIQKNSTSSAIGVTQIQTTLRFRLTPGCMAIIKNKDNDKAKDVEERELMYSVGGEVSCSVTIEINMEAPQKAKKRATI